MRRPSDLVSPMERSTPYSQLASVTFYVIEINRRKKAMKREIEAMMAMNRLKIWVTALKLSTMSLRTKIELVCP